jgi:hypothetical protein
MQTSTLSLFLSLAGAAALQLHAQPASADAQNRALELLRHTISQEQTGYAGSRPAEPATGLTPMQPPATAASFSDQQERAIMLLRQKVAESDQAGATAVQPRPRATRSGASTTLSPRPGTRSHSVTPPPASKPAAPALDPSAPRTKQQRLAELLEQYRADKLSPTEYQAARAKILAEP